MESFLYIAFLCLLHPTSNIYIYEIHIPQTRPFLGALCCSAGASAQGLEQQGVPSGTL